MKAAAVFLVLVVSKTAVLAGHHVTWSLWSPFAWFWQDAAVALAFALLDRLLRRASWALYGAASIYIAVNVPVGRVLGTPLTPPMLRAAAGPLADSIRHYVDWTNALLCVAVLATAVAAPLLCRRVHTGRMAAVLVWFILTGPYAASRVDTLGLDRNALTALWSPVLRARSGDWRTAGFDQARYPDLTWLRSAAAGRNVILVSLESTAAQYVSREVMPNFMELAESALVFENAYATYPESIKGLYSLLCSAYPVFGSDAEDYGRVPCPSLAATLAEAGYRTALFHSGRFNYLGMNAVVRNRGFAVLEDAGDIGGNRHSSFGVDEPSTIARLLRWIDTLPKGERFFAAYLPIAGHHPYETDEPGPFPDDNDFDRYRNALHAGDASLGALIRGIEARGLAKRTVWVVVGDHGEAFGQHEGNYGHTFYLFEENVHVPFLVALPGLVTQQIPSGLVASLIDAAPTILDLLGIPRPHLYQGRSVLDPDPRLAFFLADYSRGMLGLRDGSRKFIYELDSGRRRLYDLVIDPQESLDLSTRNSGLSQWYADNLERWSSAQKQLLVARRSQQ